MARVRQRANEQINLSIHVDLAAYVQIEKKARTRLAGGGTASKEIVSHDHMGTS